MAGLTQSNTEIGDPIKHQAVPFTKTNGRLGGCCVGGHCADLIDAHK